MELINLTPHKVRIIRNGCNIILPACKHPPRLKREGFKSGYVELGRNTIPIYDNTYTNCAGLPSRKHGVFYIVSSLIAQSYPDRRDFLIPNPVRDEEKNIIGCTSFSRVLLKKRSTK